ncbi:MAG TPA: putative ABC exporter domain-containing protein [Fimbriimonadaceae bacterium]|nr:putative ABC exporter domain-containing protein [Fimbriimonadaceae bacterium]
MIRAVALLSWWKFRNSLRTLLSDPRKLIPAAIILLILSCSFLPLLIAGNMPTAHKPVVPVDPTLLHAGIALVTVLIGAAIIDSGLGDNLLAFAMPDVDYLFPSPISRRVVMLYRLPAMTFAAIASCGIVVFFAAFFKNLIGITVPNMGTSPSSSWIPLIALSLCVGTYLNLSLFIAIQFQRRVLVHRCLVGAIVLLLAVIGFVGWQSGIESAVGIVESPWLRWGLLPSRLATDAIYAATTNHPVGPDVAWLTLAYALSLCPLFASNANYYERSIVTSERAATIRSAAKSGYAAMMAARASTGKHRKYREYTLSPFGRGAMAVFWAHLCAAAKKWFATFALPTMAGIAIGVVAVRVGEMRHTIGLGIVLGAGLYASMLFMTGGRTASEAAVRRRDLIAPLPIPGWKVVAANLGVPWLVGFLFGFATALTYTIGGGWGWGTAILGLVVFLPLHFAVHTLVLYGIVLGYADLADKVQQLLGGFVYYVFAGPIMIADAVVGVPAYFVGGVTGAVVALIVVQIPAVILLLLLVGRASDRAIASGEPVTLIAALRKAA